MTATPARAFRPNTSGTGAGMHRRCLPRPVQRRSLTPRQSGERSARRPLGHPHTDIPEAALSALAAPAQQSGRSVERGPDLTFAAARRACRRRREGVRDPFARQARGAQRRHRVWRRLRALRGAHASFLPSLRHFEAGVQRGATSRTKRTFLCGTGSDSVINGGHNQPPVKPARRNPVAMWGHSRIKRHNNSVR